MSLIKRNMPQPATLLKKTLWHRCFLANFVKFLRTPFFIERLGWLSLHFLPETVTLIYLRQ